MHGAPKIVMIIIFVAFLIGGAIFCLSKISIQNKSSPNSVTTQTQVGEKNMKLTSPVFENNQMIPKKFTCDGDNINPPLLVSHVPENAKSFVLIVDDPDAPGGTLVHWLVFNIDPKTLQIAENSIPPQAKEGTTSFGKPGYGGPCPPSGTHRYFFKLYALDNEISLDSSAKKGGIENAMQEHIIEQTELVGLYKG